MKALLHNKTIMAALLLFLFCGNMRHLQAQTVWDGTADTDWYTNNANATSFDISTAEELAGLAQLCNAGNNFSGKSINLTADIWLNADNSTTNEWIPIGIGASNETGCMGSGNASFNGTFNGNFYKIYNMYINRSSNSGFFLKIVAATIEKSILVNPTVVSSGMSGCLVGFVAYSSIPTNIRNCMVINGNINSACNNNALLIGATWPNGNSHGITHIQNCGVTGTISGAGSYYGGITGNGGSTQTVNCYAAYTNNGSNQTAGISGYGGTLTNSYSNFYGGVDNARQNGIIKTLAEMQDATFVTTLGSAWMVDADNINDGYPVLDPCVPPSGLTATGIGPYSAGFSWSGGAGITNYYVEYGTQGFTPGTGTEIGSDYVSATTAAIPSGLASFTTYTFAVKSDCGSGSTSGWATYDFTTTILCAQPTAVTVTGATTNTIDVSWTENVPLNFQSYIVEWGESGFAPGTGAEIGTGTSSTNTYQITGLDEATTYSVAVRADCGSSDGLSLWTVISAGTTANETFGDGIWHGYVYSSPTPKTFDAYLGLVYEDENFDRSSSAAWTGDQNVGADMWAGTAPSDNFSVRYKMTKTFPCGNYTFTIGNNDYARLSIDGGQTWLIEGNWISGTYGQNFSNSTPWYSDGITPIDMVFEFNEATGAATARFQYVAALVNITTSNLTSSSIDLAFESGNAWNVVVSDHPESDPSNPEHSIDVQTSLTSTPYSVSGLTPGAPYWVYVQTDCGGIWNSITFTTPSTCLPPTALAFNATTNLLTWTEAGGMTDWEIKMSSTALVNPSLDEADIIDNGTASGTPEFLVSANFQEDTTYHFYVRANCQDGNFSAWTSYPFTLRYCTARPSSVDNMGIIKVAFGQYPPVNDTIIPAMANGNSYRNRSSVMGGVLAMQTNVTVNITYSAGFSYGTKIYVDWNHDYDFDDPGENIYTGLSTNARPTTLVCDGAIPTNTPGGIYRMRIVGTDTDAGGAPCYTGTYGAVVDYNLLLIGGDCIPVLDLTASVVGSSFADISWTGSGNAGSYTVEYGLADSFIPGDGSASSEVVNDTAITLQGLAPNSTYTVAVKAHCDEEESMWMTFTFTTIAPCEVPSALSVSNVTNSSARLDWTIPVENVTSFEIEVGLLGFTPGEGTAVYTATETGAFHIIPTGALSDTTTYTVKIRSVCAGMGESEWISQNFRTTAYEEFGNGEWNGYVYAAPSITDTPANRFMGAYLGIVTEPAQFTRPSSAAAWTGATSTWVTGTSGPLEDFVVRYKMTYDFPCGDYTITIPSVDDAARLSIDGGQTWLSNLCSGTSCGNRLWNTTSYVNGTYTAIVYLEGSTDLVLEFFEKGGNAAVGFQYAEIPITITTSNLTPTSVDVNLPGIGGWNIKVSTVALSDPATETGNIWEGTAGTSPHTISSLLPDSTYYIYAQRNCASIWGSTTVTMPAACPLPTGVSYDVVTDQLTWDALGQTGWNIKVSTIALTDPSNETADVIDNGVATGTPSYTPGVLQDGETYHIYVQSDCGSEWAHLQVDMFYCIPTTAGTGYYLTSAITTGGLDNFSFTGGIAGAYFDHTDLRCIQTAGFPVSVALTTTYSYVRGFVDWNRDFDFDDTNETVFISNTYSSSHAGSINIPTNTPSGRYRLRILNNSAPTINSPCAINSGSVHDYTLVVVSSTDCVPPLSANVTGITDNSAHVNWLPYTPNPASDYAIYLTTDATAPDENTTPTYTTSDTTYLLSGLDEATAYQVWVRANCGDGNSMWLNVHFMTKANETYGNDEWNGYVYTSPADRQFINYLGSVNEPVQFVRDVDAAAWTGENPTFIGTAPDNKFSVRYRMNYNFPGNNYVFTVNADDNFRFSVDGGDTWLPFTSGATTTTAATGFWTTTANAEWHSDTIEITGSNNLVLEFYENTGDAALNFSFVNIDCEVPSNIVASNFTDSTADISWDAGTSSAWTVKYGLAGFNVSTGGSTEEVTANFCQMTGLVGGGVYDVYVRTNCPGGDISTWTKLTFQFPCSTITTLPYMENFDTYGTGATAFANCWERYNGGAISTTRPYINTTYHSAPGSMYFSSSDSLTLVSPAFDTDINTLSVSFWLRKEGVSSGTFSVGYYTIPGNLNTFVALQTLNPTSNYTWLEYTVDLSEAPAGVKQIAFRQNQILDNWFYWLDDVSVFTNTCPVPTALAVSNLNNQTADISWSAGGDETEWTLKYGPAGFDVNTGGTPVANITTNSYQIATSGLNVGGTYDVYVQSNCSVNDNSLWVKVSFTVPCQAITTLPYSENFDTTPTGTASSPSVPTCWSYLSNNNKGPYVAATGAVYCNSSPNCLDFNWPGATAYALAALPPLDASILINSLEVSFYGRNSNMTAGEFIVGVMTNPADYNTFTPVDTMPKTVTLTPYSVNFANYSGNGQYIAFLWIGGSGNGYYLDDVVVDYSGTTVVCHAPSNVTASDISQSSATISWTASASAVSYMLEYKKVSEANYGTPIPVTGTSYSLAGLTANTAYNVRVKSVCTDGESNYANAAPFTTLSVGGCNPPTNLLVTNILDKSATVTWTAGGDETSWVVEHRKEGDAYSSQTVNQNTANLINLDPSTLYDVRVKAVCGSDNESEYTSTTFNTEPEGVVHYTITPSVTGNGTITPATAVQVVEGGSQRFEFAPDSGQVVSDVLIDGASDTWNTGDNSYTFTDVQANHTITVLFTPNGIENYDLGNSVFIFPNPTENTLNVKTEMVFETVTITNMLGQEIHYSTVNDLNFSINVSSYNAGVYFIKLSGSAGSAVKKFVVN
ncbi:MAG: fibronectin type III domain-containing protein [Bacteroidales bacterium]|jgi:hypothetical protein|nr:fibronectin type III domain-containing protein [Bacteroidales bacterium]